MKPLILRSPSTRWTPCAISCALLGGMAGVWPAACDLEELYCGVAIGDYALRLEPIDGATCLPPLMVFGLEPLPGVGKLRPDYQTSKMAIQSLPLTQRMELGARVGAMGDADPTHVPYAMGPFAAAHPDAKNLCRVPTLAPAEQNLAAFSIADDPATMDVDETLELPAVHERYIWQNIVAEVSPAVQGTRFWGQLSYEDVQSGCAGSYRVVGVWPVVTCMNVADCAKKCETIDAVAGQPPTESCTKSQLNPDWLANDIDCLGAVAAANPAEAVQGLCVLKQIEPPV